MTYLPSRPLGIAGLLSGPDDVTVIQNGISRRATLAQLAAFVASTAPAGESAEGTIVTTVGPTITDAAGNTYGISPAGFVVTNGQPETLISANVAKLIYHAPTGGSPRQLYQQDSSNVWRTRTSVTAAYYVTAAPLLGA